MGLYLLPRFLGVVVVGVACVVALMIVGAACVLVLVLIAGFTVLEVRFDNGTFRDGPKSSFLKNDCRSSDVLNNSGVLPVVVMSVGAVGAVVGVRLMNSTASLQAVGGVKHE